jgi:hypothetical protein
MHSRVMRWFLAPLLAVAAAVGGVTAPAWAGEDKGMCKADDGRVQIPGNFPIDACFDGKTLYLLNGTQFPLVLSVTGDGLGTPKLYTQGEVDGASALLAYIRPGDFSATQQINGADVHSGVMPPNYHLKVDIGNKQAKIHIGTADSGQQRMYAIAEAIWRYTPTGGAAKAVVDFVNEISQVGDEYLRCLARNGAWGDVGCALLMGRNVEFAVGRAVFNGVATSVVKAVVALFDSAKWSNAAAGDLKSISGGTRDFTIASYTPPPPPQQTTQAPPPNNNGSGGGNNNPPPPQNNNPPPPAPTGRQVVIQNMVLNGPTAMVEGDPPIYFSTQMRAVCRLNGCMVPDSWMNSGTVITVTCQAQGPQMTNSNLHDPSDDSNPGLATSTLWYQGSGNGKSGWISEIWIRADGRGGLGLPGC